MTSTTADADEGKEDDDNVDNEAGDYDNDEEDHVDKSRTKTMRK